VKAPQFDGVPGFEKEQNGLFEVHTCMTDQGLVFVNLVSGESAAFDGDMRVAGMGVGSCWVTGQTLLGDFNWKAGGK
jgi:hypothetical protein